MKNQSLSMVALGVLIGVVVHAPVLFWVALSEGDPLIAVLELLAAASLLLAACDLVQAEAGLQNGADLRPGPRPSATNDARSQFYGSDE